MRVLIFGSGGREVALHKKLKASENIARVFVAPGNEHVPSADRVDVPYNPLRPEDWVAVAIQRLADLVIVGPEQPLVDGIAEWFEKRCSSIHFFGPSRLAAQLEGSKIFFKTRCKKWNIPTADFDFAGSFAVAEKAIKQKGFRIIKASGLAGGKGVEVTASEEEALEAAKKWLTKGPIVMEERLEGIECSVLALCDGVQSVLLPTARDYKRAYDGNKGPNTGGMGSYAPCFDVSGNTLGSIKMMIDMLLLRMRKDGERFYHPQEHVWQDCVGIPYHGVLYAGVMLTKNGPKLLEVNCRFGDPETQAILPLVEGDILPYLVACTRYGGLSKLPSLRWKSGASVCVCLADEEYPLQGKRLQSIVGTGETVAAAREEAYRKVAAVPQRDKFHYRTDIAAGV